MPATRTRPMQIDFLDLPELMAAAAESAVRYAIDAEILLNKKSNSHAFSLALLGYEELAKALVALRKYDSNKKRFIKSKQSFNVTLPSELFSDHVFKLKQIPSHTKWVIDHLIKGAKYLGAPKIKVNKKGLRQLIYSYKQLAKQGHQWRMESTYINYNKNNRQVLPKRRPPQNQLGLFIRRLGAAATYFNSLSKFYLSQARNFRQGKIPP